MLTCPIVAHPSVSKGGADLPSRPPSARTHMRGSPFASLLANETKRETRIPHPTTSKHRHRQQTQWRKNSTSRKETNTCNLIPPEQSVHGPSFYRQHACLPTKPHLSYLRVRPVFSSPKSDCCASTCRATATVGSFPSTPTRMIWYVKSEGLCQPQLYNERAKYANFGE